MRQFAEDIFRIRQKHVAAWPSIRGIHAFIDDLRELLFPHVSGEHEYDAPVAIEARLEALERDAERLLQPQQRKLPRPADETARSLMQALPEINRALWLDAQAIHDGDPASANVDEVIAAYPGFFAVYAFRIAHQLHRDGVPLLPRIISEYAHFRTGIDIHPGATIGRRFCIDHGTGIVIGETTVIGNNVKLYQGVSLGAMSVTKQQARTKRHPTVEDDVVIYSSATILGGTTTIGRNSVIGGNVWLTESVPPNSIVYHTSEIKVRARPKGDDPVNFSI